MSLDQRSGCPINLSVETFGDRWSLVILRDMMFGNRRHFRDLLTRSDEGISSSMLADRLRMLGEQGLVTNLPDPGHKQRTVYSLTEKAIQLVPVFAMLGAWGVRHLPVTEPLAVRARLLAEGGPALWERFMEELREQHVRRPLEHVEGAVLAEMGRAYEAARAAGARDAG